MTSYPSDVKPGPLTLEVLDTLPKPLAKNFPADQAWANEFETALEFLGDCGVLDSFRKRMQLGERGVWSELWAACFFHRLDFQISRWEPKYVPNKPGDFEIAYKYGAPIFVEVKRPGWKGELSDLERDAGRKDKPKYIQAEGRSYDNASSVVHSIKNALPKFRPLHPNLVVVADDLFVSPLVTPNDSLFESRFRRLTLGQEFDIVSGVLLLLPVSHSGKVRYRSKYIEGRGAPLPEEIREIFFELQWGSGAGE